MKKIDAIGNIYDRLKVIRFSHRTNKSSFWVCSCKCGNETVVSWGSLKNKTTKSCGCFRREMNRKKLTIHGLSRTKEYRVWQKMKERCLLERANGFRYYGGRGIKVCKRWMNVKNFIKDMGACPPRMSIERIDNNKDYQPNNCRWATSLDQGNNKRNNVLATINGVSRTIAQWARIRKIRVNLIYQRISRGWSPERAVLT